MTNKSLTKENQFKFMIHFISIDELLEMRNSLIEIFDKELQSRGIDLKDIKNKEVN